MTRTLTVLAAVIALIAAPALAASSGAPAAGPFKLDSKGKCRATKHCRDPKTSKFIKCDHG
jgi:hypothetical protein